ncbi:MAG: serine hydrolase [Bacteroidia bacterium]
MTSFLKGGKWPLYKVLLACLLTGIFTYGISQQLQKARKPREAYLQPEAKNPTFRTIRLKDYKYIQPIVMTEISKESDRFNVLKDQFKETIQRRKADDKDFEASIYLKSYDDGSWASINPEATFDPGSILKLPVLIAVLRKAQLNPGILEERILFDKPHVANYRQNIAEESLTPGNRYSVKELLKFLLVNSDNEADYLLFNFLDRETILKVFSDLEMQVPDPNQSTVKLNCVDVSKFLRVLYNSGYTDPKLSEFTMQLMEQSKYHEGMYKGLPDDATLVHKFGERGYVNTSFQELCETGIIYIGEHRMLLTVLTRGNNQKKQAAFIAEITGQVCNWIKSNHPNS